ncbi:hypothetical protein [Microvirga aerophila]|nr:hypothetical protein [Microvirga aerophila]
MSLIYIPPGHVWLIEMAVAVAHLCYPERWGQNKLMPNEKEFWDGIVTGRYKSEGIRYILEDRYRDVDWSVLSPQTCRYYAYDQALQVLQVFLAEGAIQAKFVDDDNQGAIDHIRGESFRTEDGKTILVRGYAFLADSPEKRRYIFVNENDVIRMLRKMGALRFDPDGPSTKQNSEANPHSAEPSSFPTAKGPQSYEATGKVRESAGRKTTAVKLAVDALWPAGIPRGLAVKERDRQIRKWAEQNGHSIPTSRTISRFIKQ